MWKIPVSEPQALQHVRVSVKHKQSCIEKILTSLAVECRRAAQGLLTGLGPAVNSSSRFEKFWAELCSGIGIFSLFLTVLSWDYSTPPPPPRTIVFIVHCDIPYYAVSLLIERVRLVHGFFCAWRKGPITSLYFNSRGRGGSVVLQILREQAGQTS